jgi:polysaccharide biosynthesis/export protein
MDAQPSMPVKLCAERSALGVILLTAGVVACAHPDPYVWVDDFREQPSPVEGYVIRPGDVLNIKVWNQESFPSRIRVRNDGRITLPLVNDVEAAGYTPAALGSKLQSSLKPFIVNPVVTVSLEESRVPTVSVIGEVNKPGIYPLEPDGGVLQALASAGGMTIYADRDRIFVLRHRSPLVRVRFSYERLARGVGRAMTFGLKDGDVVVVE